MPVVDTSRSPHARLRPTPLGAVRLLDRFWEPRRRINRTVTLPSQYRRCEETGRIDNFRRAAGKKAVPFQGRYYNDSDVYKWVEACAFALADGPDPELRALMERVIREIADAQQPDGYLNTYFMFERATERWTNLRDLHELYCAGHLLQAAVAHQRVTGESTLLDVALRLADHVCATFGPEGRNGTCGHQEIEMALVELYRLTGDSRYLLQARLFIERRGQKPPVLGGSPYHQDHAPFLALDAPTGHAVRMMYYCCGAADVVAETGDAAWREVLDRIWRRMVARRQYVTGGLGARYEGEAFGEDYELPNERAYAETCAAIGSLMWNWRMLLLTGEARFADEMETALYNGMLAGLSLDGERYFYQNPLADRGAHRRTPWFDCACCPPNLARMLASLPGYFYSTDDRAVWVHLYATNRAELSPGGQPVRLMQRTEYPWEGEIEITLETDVARPLELHLRVPGWARSATLQVNGEPPVQAAPAGYASTGPRCWRAGETVRLSLGMPVERLRCHPRVVDNVGRVALRRGPLIYCVEQTDLGGIDPRDLLLPADSPLSTRWEPDLLGGVVAITGPARTRPDADAWGDALYAADPPPAVGSAPTTLKAIPYYAWANREPGGMAVWIREGE